VIKISKFSNTIEYNLRTTLDASGITQLQGQLASISTQLDQMQSKKLISPKEVYAAQRDIKQLGDALSSSLNSQTGLLDLSQFQKQLSGLSLSQLEQFMSKVGSTGQIAFGNMIGQIGRIDTSFKSISSFADKIFNTMGNTVRWGVTASIFQTIQNSLYRAVDYVQELDTSLNNIRIVTSASNEDMRDFALYANQAAQSIGASTTSFTDAAQLYAQNGFNEEDYTRLAEITTKVANVTQQDTTAVSEQITALMAGYNMSIDQVEESLGGMAVVAAASAADLEELATAEQKVASTANTLGVSQEQLTAQIGTIVSVTRQAPETVGNAMRTLYARIADLQMGETLEDGTTLGDLSGTLADIGVNVLDAEGNLRNLGDVLEELQAKWGDLSNAQQIALGTKLAGKYQLNPFMALMENADMYQEQLEMMQTSGGALDEQQALYMDSMQARMQSLSTAAEGVISNLFNPDDLKPGISALTDVLNLITQIIDALGGVGPILTGIGGIATKIFSNQIGQSINNMITNATRANQKQIDTNNIISQMGGIGDASGHTSSAQFVEQNYARQAQMSKEQQEAYNVALQETINLENQLIAAKDQEALAQKELTDYMRQNSLVRNPLTDNGNVSEATSAFQKQQADDLEKLDLAIGKVIGKINNFDEAQTGLQNGTKNYVEVARQMRNALGEYSEYFSRAGIDVEKFTQQLQGLGRANTTEELAQQQQMVGQMLDTMRAAQQELAQRVDNTNTVINNLDAAQRNKVSTESAISAQGDRNQAQTDMLDSQARIQSIAAIAGAIGQLAFSWQSFQSLGSIWVNADLDGGEKLAQIIEVLLFSLPSLISGVADLQNSLKDLGLAETFAKGQGPLKSFANTFTTLKSTGASAATAIVGGLGSMATAATGAAGAFAALMAEIWPLLAIGAVIGVISGVIGGIQQAEEDRVQAISDAANAASENLSSLQEAQSNFDSLYESYRKGEASSSDLAAAAETLNNLIDDQAAKAYAAAGNWDAYAAAVANASAEQALANQSTMQAATWEAERAFAEAPGWGASGHRHRDDKDFGNEGLNKAWNSADSLSYNGSDFEFAANTSAEQRLQDLEDFDTAYQEAIQEATDTLNSIDDTSSDAYKEAQNNLNNLQDTYNQFTSFRGKYSDEINAVNEAYQAQVDNLLAGHMNEADFQYQGGTVDEYTEQVRAALEAQGIHASEQVVQAFVQGMMNSDATGAEELAAQAGKEAADEAFSTNMTDKIGNTISSQGIDYSSMVSGGSISQDQYTQEMIANMRQQIADSGLTESEQLDFIANIDWSKSLSQIQSDIDNLEASESLPKLEFEPTLTDRSDFSEEDISELLDETGMSQNAFDRMTADTFNDMDNGIGQRAQQIEEEIEALQASGDASEETADKIADLRQEYEDLGNTTEDISAYNLQMNKGVSKLVDSWEDLSAVIGDDAAKGTSDYYEALGELDEIMSDILNIDTGSLSNDFYNNAEAIDAMSRAAQGDASAIDDLRRLAAEDLVMNLDIQGVSAEDSADIINNDLLPMLTNLQAYLDGMPLGTVVDADTSPFIAKLNQMLLAGQITAEQVSNILSSIGMDATIGTKTQETTQEYTAYFPKFSVEKDENGVMTGLVPAGVTPVKYKATETVEMPYIEGATYTGSGISTVGPVSSGRTGGGGRGGGGGGKKGGGGGGGGGSGKSYEPQTKDPIEDEVDRYERVNAELDTLANRFEAVADEQERLAGFDVADNMNKQIALIKEQIKWEQEKLKIQKDEAEEYRNQLASQYGITYDAEGHITNYADVYKRLLNELNGLISQYNATTTEEGQEALDKQIEAAQDNFDDYNDLIEKYDELVSNSVLETEKQIEDFYDQIEDLQIEAFQKAVDAVDNIKDLQETLIDFNAVFTGLDSDSPFRDMLTSLENLKTYWDVNTESVDEYYDELIRRNNEAMKNASESQKQNLQYQNALLEAAREQYGKGTFEEGGTGLFDMEMARVNTILEQMRQFNETGTSTIFGKNSGSMYEVANDIFEQATSLLEDYEGHLDDLKDAILDAIDEIGDKMDERLETYENINDELEHYADIIEMVQGDEAGQLDEVSQGIINNNQARINELKQNIALWQDMLASMEEGSDEWKAIQEYITDAQQDLLETTSDTVEEMLEMYERGVSKILDKWIGSTGMGDDLDWIGEEWELINRNADYYLDDVNAAYEIQKLQGKYLDLLDQSNDLSIQNQITQQMAQQLEYLREKEKLSEYDVQYANAQLEILQKQIALQEAQRNKSQLQLRRDTQGNYSYVYTADEDDVRGAQSNLLDAQNNAYNLSKDQMKQTQDDSLSALQDARDMLEQIWTNANLTLEEKTKRTQTIIDSLKEYLAGTSEQLSTSEENIINDFIGMCEILTDENSQNLQDVYDQIINGNKDAFDQIDTRWQTSITNWLQNMEEFNAATDSSFKELIDNFSGYQSDLDDLGDLAGMTFDDMSDSIQNAVDKTNDLASSTSDFINQLKNDAGTVKEYENALAEMTAKIQDAENGMRAYQEQVNELQQNLTAKEQENANLSSQVQDLQNQLDAIKNPSGNGGGSGGGGGSADSATAWGIAQAIWTYGQASGWGNDPIRSTKLTKAYGTAFAKQVQQIINQNYRSGKLVNYDSMTYSSYNLIGYRTGGYTGDWNDTDGKVGILHEKELVLNQDDTRNILNAVDMVRSMTALARNGNYNDIIRQSAGVVDMASVVQPMTENMGETIYQVECTFPNATKVDEIQQAILSLPDIAPQYAYKY
jgi:TP901 family phage tail tape measure protein